MDKPVKVLYFVDRMLRGGIQSLVMDWVSRFDKNKIHVDFLLLDDGNEYELENTLRNFGCTIYKLKNIWINSPMDFIRESTALNKFFKEHHDYKVVHMHSTSKNYMVLKYAKKYGIPIRIAHAHASDFQSGSFTKKAIGNFLKPKLVKYSTDFFACSYDAGKWLFGEKIVKSSNFSIIKNGIDYDRFKYNPSNRMEIRTLYNVKKEEILIGHVGRFTEVKNHLFMVELLGSLLKTNKNYKMMFVGDGVLKKQVVDYVNSKGLNDYIIFAGFQNNVEKYMSAFDMFILPSIYEGLGLVLIEAQANGLYCLATKDKIPSSVKLGDNFKFVELTIDEWEKNILQANFSRKNNKENLKNNGYLISDVSIILTNKYTKERKKVL